MKTILTNTTVLLSVLFIFLCARTDTLYNPTDRQGARCFAFLSDSFINTPAPADTAYLATIDTIPTNDSIVLIGIITPTDADLASAVWNFGDGTAASKPVAIHRYSKSRVYTGIFTIKDRVGITLSDTVTVHVNTRPRIISLIAPADRAKDVDPKDVRGIRFQWAATDPDDHDSLRTSLYISADSLFLQPSATNIRASVYDYIGNLKILEQYYWRIIVTDNYGWSDTSAIYSFTTKDPAASGGILQGYAFYQGWNNHRGIKIIAAAPEALTRTARTDESGFYRITNIDPRPNYTIIAMDSMKNEYVADTTSNAIITGVITIADTLFLKDPFRPIVANPLPQNRVITRMPDISASFSDRGSGILVSSACIMLNDLDVTPKAIISGTGIQWKPPTRLPDQSYRVAICVKDSAGNQSDTLKWQFIVDAMQLSILTPDTAVRINDTIAIRSRVINFYSKVEQYKWDFDGNGTWDDSAKTTDTIVSRQHVYRHEAQYKAVVYACDDSGMVKTDTVTITVGNQPPIISAIRADTTISIKDSILLFGVATDADGTIKEYAWDFDGDGTFDYTSVTEIQAGYRYNTAGIYKAVLRVTDDDGKASKDTAIVTVLQDVPQITFISTDTIVDHGGSVRCSVYVQQQFGTMVVAIDTETTGTFKDFRAIGLAGGAMYSFSTLSASQWDSVKVRVTDDDGNTAVKGFKVDIRPRPLVITSIDSTVTTITVNYSQSQETDFAEYRIYRNTTNSVDMASELWATISASGTVSYTTPTPGYAWEPRYYRVYQKDSEGLWSAGSNVVYGNIKNSPPPTPVITWPTSDGDSIWSNEMLRWECRDPNDHIMKYRIMVDYNNTGYAEYASDLIDKALMLNYDSLGFAVKVIAYDSEGDSSGWSAQMSAFIRNTVSDIDGNVYKVVRIGKQLWTAENLRTTKFNDETDTPLVTDDSAWFTLTTPAYCWYNNTTDAAEHEKWGALYNWYTVNTDKLAPAGWHVPTDAEWTELENYLIANGYNLDGTTTGNKIAKSLAAKTDWTPSTTPGTPGNDPGSNNSSGFSALPGGYRHYYSGFFLDIGWYGYWWSATESNASIAWCRSLYCKYEYLCRISNLKGNGYSVRLLRD